MDLKNFGFEILGFQNFRGKFLTFHFALALVAVMEVVAGVVVSMVVKFGDHRRWSEPAARGGATGL